MINIGDTVNFTHGKNNYCGRVVVFVPKKIDAFKFRDKFEEVKDTNFNFTENFNRVIVVVPSGKRNCSCSICSLEGRWLKNIYSTRRNEW